MGGRCAEALVLIEISSGASGDLQQVTNIVRHMITRLGMSDELGPLVFGEHQEQVFLGRSLGHERNYGEAVAAKIDAEMHKIVSEAYNDVMQLLADNEQFLHNMANALLEEETIDHAQIENLYKYGTLTDPTEGEGEDGAKSEVKSALEAAGIIVPDSIHGNEAKSVDPDTDKK